MLAALVEAETATSKDSPPAPTATAAAAADASGADSDTLQSVAATALSLQPTGYTLATTAVKTAVPTPLLRRTLREYQHVGLDWLVTMHDNRLNGILADEMGTEINFEIKLTNYRNTLRNNAALLTI